MSSTKAKILRAQLQLINPLLKNMSLYANRNGMDKLGALGARAQTSKITFEHCPAGQFEADWAVPSHTDSTRATLYLHGGAYAAGSLKYARGMGGVLANATGQRTLCIGYRLAPEHPFPAALDDALFAYDLLLHANFDPAQITLAGESAGGGLCCSLIRALHARGLPLPACIALISPWMDLTLSGASVEANASCDPTLSEEFLHKCARFYAGDDLKNPLASPLFGNFSMFPPSIVFAGGNELLRSDAERFAAQMFAAGRICQLIVEEGLWHAYVLFGIPEARSALRNICAFIDAHTQSQA